MTGDGGERSSSSSKFHQGSVGSLAQMLELLHWREKGGEAEIKVGEGAIGAAALGGTATKP